MAINKEEPLAKAKAKWQQQKSTAADDPVIVPGTYPPKLKTPELPVQDTKSNPMGKLQQVVEARFWCSYKNFSAIGPAGEKIEFVNHGVTLRRAHLIAHMRQLTKLYPARFKEL